MQLAVDEVIKQINVIRERLGMESLALKCCDVRSAGIVTKVDISLASEKNEPSEYRYITGTAAFRLGFCEFDAWLIQPATEVEDRFIANTRASQSVSPRLGN